MDTVRWHLMEQRSPQVFFFFGTKLWSSMPSLGRGAASGHFLGDVNDERRLKLIALIIEGQNAGLIPETDPDLIVLTSEALIHGLARMVVDGHPRVVALSSEDTRKLALAATQLLQSGIGLS